MRRGEEIGDERLVNNHQHTIIVTANVAKVIKFLSENPYTTHRRISEITGIKRSTITKIINRL